MIGMVVMASRRRDAGYGDWRPREIGEIAPMESEQRTVG